MVEKEKEKRGKNRFTRFKCHIICVSPSETFYLHSLRDNLNSRLHQRISSFIFLALFQRQKLYKRYIYGISSPGKSIPILLCETKFEIPHCILCVHFFVWVQKNACKKTGIF